MERMRWLGACVGVLVAVACQPGTPHAAGPPVIIKRFATDDTPIAKTGVRAEDGGWRIESPSARTVRLFEIDKPGVEQAVLMYRCRLRTEGVQGRVYLEMWVRLPGHGEFFSRGLDHAVSGTNGWASYQTPFFLQKGQRADLIRLNLVFEGDGGTVWIKDIEVEKTPRE